MDNGTLAIITPDQYDEACNIMANYFFPDNPLCKSFGVTWNEPLNEVTLAILKMNLSVCMMTRDTKEIMGVRITGVKTKSDPPENFCPEEEPLKALLTLTTLQEKEVNVFERYEVDEVVDFLALAVKLPAYGCGWSSFCSQCCDVSGTRVQGDQRWRDIKLFTQIV